MCPNWPIRVICKPSEVNPDESCLLSCHKLEDSGHFVVPVIGNSETREDGLLRIEIREAGKGGSPSLHNFRCSFRFWNFANFFWQIVVQYKGWLFMNIHWNIFIFRSLPPRDVDMAVRLCLTLPDCFLYLFRLGSLITSQCSHNCWLS